MEFLTINTLDEGSGLSKTATRIQRTTDGDLWITPNRIFGETTAVEVSETKSDYE